MTNLRRNLIRLAHDNRDLRAYLLPLLMDTTTKTASLSKLQENFVHWVKGDPGAMAAIRKTLGLEIASTVSDIHRHNNPPPPPRVLQPWEMPKVRGRKKVVPTVVEQVEPPPPHVPLELSPAVVVQKLLAGLDASLFSAINEWDFKKWFDEALTDLANPIYFNYPPWVYRSYTETKNGAFVWDGILVGDTWDDDVEVPDDRSLEDDKVNALVTRTGGKQTRLWRHSKFIRDYGEYGSHFVTYELTAEWPVAPQAIVSRLFTDKELLDMAEQEIEKATD